MKPIDIYIRNKQNDTRDDLNKAFDLGWQACEECIIKILEEADSGCSGWAIALIKGETE